jgi:hypothetical protein
MWVILPESTGLAMTLSVGNSDVDEILIRNPSVYPT